MCSLVTRKLREIDSIEDFDAEGRGDLLDSGITEERLRVFVIQSFVTGVNMVEGLERREFEAVGPVRKETTILVVLFGIEALDLFGRDGDVERRDGLGDGLSSGGRHGE